MFVVPAPGATVRDPATGLVLPTGGATVPDNGFWATRLLQGDVLLGGSPGTNGLTGVPATATAGIAIAGVAFTLASGAAGYIGLFDVTRGAYDGALVAVSGASGPAPALAPSAAGTYELKLASDSAGATVLASSGPITARAPGGGTAGVSSINGLTGDVTLAIPSVGTAAGTVAAGNDPRITGAVQRSTVPASAPLLGADASAGFQVIGVGAGLSLSGNTLSAAGSRPPSALAAAAALGDTDKLAIAQGADDSFDKVATPAQLAAYVAAKNGSGAGLPAAAPLIGTTTAGSAQAVLLDPSLTLTGTTLAVAQSAPSGLAAAAALGDTDKLPIAQGADDTFGKTATPALLKSYMDSKRPASAALLGTTAGGAEQAIALDPSLTLTGSTLKVTTPGLPYSRPALSSMTWLNQGSATASDIAGGPLVLACPAQTGDNIRGLGLALPAPPFTIRAAVRANLPHYAGINGGLFVRNTVSGALNLMKFGSGSDLSGSTTTLYPDFLLIENWTNVTAFSAQPYYRSEPFGADTQWLGLTCDGTTASYYFSRDGGYGWRFLFSQAASASGYAAGNAMQGGIYLNTNDTKSTGSGALISLLSLEISSSLITTAPATTAYMG